MKEGASYCVKGPWHRAQLKKINMDSVLVGIPMRSDGIDKTKYQRKRLS